MAKMMGFTGFETSKGKEHEDAGGMSKKTKRRARQYMNRKVSGGGPPRSLAGGGPSADAALFPFPAGPRRGGSTGRCRRRRATRWPTSGRRRGPARAGGGGAARRCA